jgi:NAD(P)-dependent dehydrogenase (short-subunit alcohol dehydrogenase family)
VKVVDRREEGLMSVSLFDLSGRVAVVIGGTTGLGHEICLGLAAAGADVVPSSRRQEQVNAAAAEIEALGRRSLRVSCDVLDRGSVERLHDAVLETFGKVDILVNAAGITQKVPTLEVSDADWSRVIETNLTGTMRTCQIFGATMARAGYGRIINISSSQQERGGLIHQDAGDRIG